MTEILAVLLFAVLFAAFGLMRPADQAGGCHSCSHSGDGECGSECPLMRDVFDTQPETEVGR